VRDVEIAVGAFVLSQLTAAREAQPALQSDIKATPHLAA
jgi:hypothetical protein